MRKKSIALAAALSLTCFGAAADGKAERGARAAPAKKEQKPWGVAGNAKAATRTIDVLMTDDMRFRPDRIEVKQGEIVRFVVRNRGKMLHEFVLGTRKELDEHAALVRFPGMEHDEPYMIHVKRGAIGEVVWNFNRAGEFEFACLIPGHYQAGMTGKITVTPPRKQS